MYRGHRRETVAVIRADESPNLRPLAGLNLFETEMCVPRVDSRLGRLAHRHAGSRAYRKQPRCSGIDPDRVRSEGNFLAGYAARRQQSEKRNQPSRFHCPAPALAKTRPAAAPLKISGFQII